MTDDIAGVAIARLLSSIPRQMPPAERLGDLIERAGWSIRLDAVPGRRLAMCDAWRRTIIIDRRFRGRIRYRERTDQVLAERIAHELGHGVCHPEMLMQGRRGPQLEHRADMFAQRLLLPPDWVAATREMRELATTEQPHQQALWRLVLDLADSWRVTGAFAVRALESYGRIRCCPRTRELQVAA